MENLLFLSSHGSFQSSPPPPVENYLVENRASSVLNFTTTLFDLQFRWPNISLSAIVDRCSRPCLSYALGCDPKIASRFPRQCRDAREARPPSCQSEIIFPLNSKCHRMGYFIPFSLTQYAHTWKVTSRHQIARLSSFLEQPPLPL